MPNRIQGRWNFILSILAVLMMGTQLHAQFSANELSPPPEMVGKVAPRWNLKVWINTAPDSGALETAKLRGKVILLRFINDSPTGAAGVRELLKTYQAEGLAVVGIYAPSPTPTPVDREMVQDLALALGFSFPIGIDSTWQAVNRYYMNQANVEPLAASFLIDRNGLVRFVQPDGRYEKNSKDRSARRQYEEFERGIKTLLAEPVPDNAAPSADQPASQPDGQPDGQPDDTAATNPAG